MRAMLAAAGAAWLAPGLAPHVPAVCRAIGVPRRLDGAAGHVALTFDDGPHPEGTPAVVTALGDRRATFFLVGEQVERHPQLARDLAAAGHEIGVHGYRHHNQMRIPPRALADDLRRALASIGEATGVRPRLYRPPYGIFTPAGLALVRRAGLEPLMWSRWGRDWRAHTSGAEIARLATRGLSAGDVLLLHDADWYSATGSHRRTAAAVPLILAEAERRGLRVQPAGR